MHALLKVASRSFVLFAALWAAPALAVVVHPGSDNAAALDKPPVNVVGQWAGNASVVAIGPNHAITTAHQSLGPTTNVTFGSTTYRVAQITQHPTSDLRVARLEALAGGPANLTDFVQVYDETVDGSELGKVAVISGFGRGRGADLLASGVPYGYAWLSEGNNTRRWGQNHIGAIQPSFNIGPPLNFVSDLLLADFDPVGAPTAVPFEAAVAAFDSGGGWFIKVGSVWKVAGLNAYTQHLGESWYADNLATVDVESPELNSAIRLSPLSGFIAATVPEPAGWLLAVLGAAAWAALARRRAAGRSAR